MSGAFDFAEELRDVGFDNAKACAIAGGCQKLVENQLPSREDFARMDERRKAVFVVLAILTAMVGAMFVETFFSGNV